MHPYAPSASSFIRSATLEYSSSSPVIFALKITAYILTRYANLFLIITLSDSS